MSIPIFKTKRLVISLAAVGDAPLFYDLWTDPQVMANVGFPQGLPVTLEEIKTRITGQNQSPFNQLQVVRLKATDQPIGECHLHPPDQEGIASTDVKLLPEFWGHKYGVEIRRGLLEYLFCHTSCTAVQATPNIANAASIKMQEAVGGMRIGKGVTEFPETMQIYTRPVHYYIYRVDRKDWRAAQNH